MGSFAVRVAILLHSSVQQISVLCVVETTLKDLQFWSNVYECTRAIQISSTMILKTHLINMLCTISIDNNKKRFHKIYHCNVFSKHSLNLMYVVLDLYT